VKRNILLAAILALTPCTATRAAAATPRAAAAAPARIESRVTAESAIGAGWWERNKSRFQELAACTFASADITVAIIGGVSGAGGVLGVMAAAVVVAMCL
jgi:hypothetical protein